MALFGGKKTKEEKEQDKLQEFMEKYQLEEIDEKDMEVIKRVASDLVGSEFIKAGMALSMAKADDQLKVRYLSALVEQNWIIIRQLSRLNKNLESMKASE